MIFRSFLGRAYACLKSLLLPEREIIEVLNENTFLKTIKNNKDPVPCERILFCLRLYRMSSSEAKGIKERNRVVIVLMAYCNML